MPVHGARTTDGVSRTAAIPRSSNAGPRFAAWRDLARRIHSPGRRTGRAPEAGELPTHRGVIGAIIREMRPQPEGPSCERSFWSRLNALMTATMAFFEKWPFGPRIKPRVTRLRRN